MRFCKVKLTSSEAEYIWGMAMAASGRNRAPPGLVDKLERYGGFYQR